jgi:hypothetical protein
MGDKVVEVLVGRIISVHNLIYNLVKDLSEADLCLQPSPTASPIGWHVWHVTRCTDLFLASQPNQDEVWEKQEMVTSLGLDITQLGLLQMGGGMSNDIATAIPKQIGKQPLIEYTQTVFELTNTALKTLSLEDLYAERESILRFQVIDGKLIETAGANVLLIDDIGFHYAHTYRHLGMIEGLIGAILDKSGTATI